MIRLIYKEIRSSRWILALGCLGAAAFVLFRDPFFFRGDQGDESVIFFVLFFLILGLRSYSSEMKDDTIGFLYSRPIRWWQIWLAKLIAGIIGIVFVLAAASLTYVLAATDQYRPFIVEGLAGGIPLCLEMFGLAFAVGFVVSALMPGMALSFASFLVALSVLNLPFIVASMTGNPAWLKFGSVGGKNASLLMWLGAFISTILVAQRLPKLGMKERWLTWIKLPALGMALACLLAAIHFNISAECIPSTKACALSPNGRWALYFVSPAIPHSSRLVLVDIRTGQKLWSAPEERVKEHPWIPACAWAEDSSKFAYVTTDSKAKIVSVSKKPSIIWTAKISALKENPEGWMNTHILWKPDGDKLAIFFMCHKRNSQSSTGMEESRYLLDTLDIKNRKVFVSNQPAGITREAALSARSDQPVYIEHYEELFWPPGFGKP